MYHGVISVYKEKGYTSFDVVAKLRGILKQKKIGHTGTLDPDAEGVLVVCLGRATKLCGLLTDKSKTYEAVLLLGKTTDTEDSSGTVLSSCDVTATPEEIRETILSFKGEYEQIPPMYSAIKVNGKRLYELAREGEVIERSPRKVIIHDIQIQKIEIPYVTFTVSCGKGTYIRSLCRDIGEKLGCGGIMDRLIRNSVNATETGMVFTREKSHTLDKIEKLVENQEFETHILPIDAMFPQLMKCYVNEDGNKKLYNGNLLKTKDFKDVIEKPEDGEKFLVYDTDNVFCAIYQYQDKLHGFKAEQMFLMNDRKNC
ncbi:MAG: tRNA pseudouridine(55) synthase TruB [Lachnospiraceae bacterium]|nr:tRNA pseudouridine(55) synthase TruB [Lachnospiraceae bacterium]